MKVQRTRLHKFVTVKVKSHISYSENNILLNVYTCLVPNASQYVALILEVLKSKKDCVLHGLFFLINVQVIASGVLPQTCFSRQVIKRQTLITTMLSK